MVGEHGGRHASAAGLQQDVPRACGRPVERGIRRYEYGERPRPFQGVYQACRFDRRYERGVIGRMHCIADDVAAAQHRSTADHGLRMVHYRALDGAPVIESRVFIESNEQPGNESSAAEDSAKASLRAFMGPYFVRGKRRRAAD